MTELVKLETAERLSESAANRLLAGKTRITDKTHPDALAHWGLAVCEPVERPGDDYRLAPLAEKRADNRWYQVWEPVEHDIDQLRASALTQINAHFQQQAAATAGQYPAFEESTWRDQEAEALAYQRWVNNGSTPADQPACAILTGIAQQRGITLADLATRVLNNAAAWRTLAATLAGQRQAAADQLYAATDKLSIDAVLSSLPPIEQT